MLYPAQLYKEGLQKKMISKWYDPKYMYYFGEERYITQLPDNTEYRQDFVHLDSNGEVDGYFAYHFDKAAGSMSQFGLISFSDNGASLIQDAINRVKYMFKHGAQRCEFWAFADNPVCKFYKYLMKRYGGEEVGYLKRCAYFDGLYHDMIIFEVLVEKARIFSMEDD
jgi:RimJ/RimL family protein N-acetyltransferase